MRTSKEGVKGHREQRGERKWEGEAAQKERDEPLSPPLLLKEPQTELGSEGGLGGVGWGGGGSRQEEVPAAEQRGAWDGWIPRT